MTKCRSWIYAVLVIAGSFVGGVVANRLAPATAMAAKHAGTQTAQQFLLVDAGGSRRAVMRVTPREKWTRYLQQRRATNCDPNCGGG